MDPEYSRLNSKCLTSRYIRNVFVAAIFIAAYVAMLVLWKEAPLIATASAGAVLGIIILYLAIEPIVYYKRYRYAITEDRIDVRKGVIFLRHILVPIERLHQVEVVRGPINNMLGLANVSVTTAGGVASIDYLEKDVAEKIVDELNKTIIRIVRERKADAGE